MLRQLESAVVTLSGRSRRDGVQLGRTTTTFRGYVCYVRRNPGSGTHGTAGSVTAQYYSQPGCVGTLQGVRYYCSANATATSCAAGSNYTYTREDLNMLASMLQSAAIADQKVQHDDTTCIGGAQTCGTYVYYFSAP